ncbi:hypothetical protein 278BB001_191 [Bacillus phage 278BB001]|nr:hypothetical protein 278BB001_191 [Bacillus phage 278BB001]
MALPSIDTYLYKEIADKLEIILSNRYIIEEILKEIQPEVSASFIERYTGDRRLEIPIVYTMPQDKQSQRGAIYIGLREGQESQPSLGNMEDTYDFKEGNLHKEESVVAATESDEPGNRRLYLEVSEPIGDLYNVEGLEFARSDNKTIEGNRIYFKYDPSLIGLPFIVNYVAKRGDEEGLKKGFTALEHYSVLVVSTNMDTVRCLDLIVKAILIMMRSNAEEHSNQLLQKLQFGQIEEIPLGASDGATPELLYGREAIVSYTTSYNLDTPMLNMLKEININVNLDVEGE